MLFLELVEVCIEPVRYANSDEFSTWILDLIELQEFVKV